MDDLEQAQAWAAWAFAESADREYWLKSFMGMYRIAVERSEEQEERLYKILAAVYTDELTSTEKVWKVRMILDGTDAQ